MNRNKNTSSESYYTVYEDPNLGVRTQMEDFTICLPDLLGDKNYSFYCILDGHGGKEVS